MGIRGFLGRHLRDNFFKYAFLLLIFSIGLMFGASRAEGLASGTRSHLIGLLDLFLKQGNQGDGHRVFLLSAVNGLKMIGGLWFMGLTVVGLPLIAGIVFIRAFSLGFTIHFLLQEKGGTGIMIALTLLPQNLIYIPVLLAAAVTGLNFSLGIVRGNYRIFGPLWQRLISYTVTMVFLLLLIMAGALVEAYVAPWLFAFFFS